MLTGADGQLGTALRARCPRGVRLVALSHRDLDITSPAAVREAAAAAAPDWIINAAAYTAVDQAEADSARAFDINAHAVGNLGDAAAREGARLLQVSTDFVFDGTRARPYLPADEPNPLNVYGASKLAGEEAARAVLGADRCVIVRTAWVHAPAGRNFVLSVLRLLREREELRVVADQYGTPTSAAGLAYAVWRLVARGAVGTWHWTDAGVASWYDVAVAVQEEALTLGLLRSARPIVPIPSEEYPTPARRPGFAVLDKTGTWARIGHHGDHWREGIRRTLREAASARGNPAAERN
jgi:dTDP-4-dehydrorhamnose reductase